MTRKGKTARQEEKRVSIEFNLKSENSNSQDFNEHNLLTKYVLSGCWRQNIQPYLYALLAPLVDPASSLGVITDFVLLKKVATFL